MLKPSEAPCACTYGNGGCSAARAHLDLLDMYEKAMRDGEWAEFEEMKRAADKHDRELAIWEARTDNQNERSST